MILTIKSAEKQVEDYIHKLRRNGKRIDFDREKFDEHQPELRSCLDTIQNKFNELGAKIIFDEFTEIKYDYSNTTIITITTQDANGQGSEYEIDLSASNLTIEAVIHIIRPLFDLKFKYMDSMTIKR